MNVKRIICAIIAVALCLSCMAALSSCRTTKNEVVFSFADKDGKQKVDITSGTYLYYLLSAYSDFRTEFDKTLTNTGATTAADFDYEKQKLEDKTYEEWVKNKAFDYCALYAMTEKSFDEYDLKLEQSEIDSAEQEAQSGWNNGYSEMYEKNGVSYSTFKACSLNWRKLSKVYSYLYEKDEKVKGSGAKRPDDKIIKNLLPEYYVIADTLSFSLTSSSSDSSTVQTVSDEEKAAAKKKFQKYADRLNKGEKFKTIYIEENGKDIDAADNTAKDKYATVFPSEKTGLNTYGYGNTEYYEDINKLPLGKAKVLEFSDSIKLVVKRDILSDSAYFDYYKDSVVYYEYYEKLTDELTAEGKKLDCARNEGAISYYAPSKLNLETEEK